MTSRAYFITSPLPPCSPGTQRRLAPPSFPLSHYPSLCNDVPRALGSNSTSHFPTSPVLSAHNGDWHPFFPTLPLSQPPQRRASCLGVQQHIPLAHFPHTLRTQQRLAHLSFPLSHFPSLVQPPTLHTDMTWGFSTSHFPTSPPYPPITQRQLAHLSFTPWCPCLHSLVFVVRLTFLLSTESVTLQVESRVALYPYSADHF
jgi:hypothetical protein